MAPILVCLPDASSRKEQQTCRFAHQPILAPAGCVDGPGDHPEMIDDAGPHAASYTLVTIRPVWSAKYGRVLEHSNRPPPSERGTSMKRLICIGLLSASLACTAIAQSAAADMVVGEIRKVDKEARKLTIKHGAIKNLDMPPMTMVFQVKDPALLDKVKAGDSVRFVAEKSAAGDLMVTQIRPAQ
jgi:Cu(I)/Ag(I) efflux system periplasmic protein CusF